MSTTPINEAGIKWPDKVWATFAAIFARLEELEHGQEDHHTRLERLESARIAAQVAPEGAETASGVPMEPGNATEAHGAACPASQWSSVVGACTCDPEVAAALRMYRKVQGCTVDADHHFVYCGDGATWKLAENLLAWLKEGEA